MSEREKLPDERSGVTHHFSVFDRDGQTTDGYVTVGCYPDGRVGEFFVVVAKAPWDGLGALLDQWAAASSLALQRGHALEDLCAKFANVRFEPAGATENPSVPRCSSVVDYVAKWLRWRFCTPPPAAEAKP